MNEQELQALIDKWQNPRTYWRPENQRFVDRFETLFSDFMKVARAYLDELRDFDRAAAYKANVQFYEQERARIEQQIRDDAKRDDEAKRNGLA